MDLASSLPLLHNVLNNPDLQIEHCFGCGESRYIRRLPAVAIRRKTRLYDCRTALADCSEPRICSQLHNSSAMSAASFLPLISSSRCPKRVGFPEALRLSYFRAPRYRSPGNERTRPMQHRYPPVDACSRSSGLRMKLLRCEPPLIASRFCLRRAQSQRRTHPRLHVSSCCSYHRHTTLAM